MNFLPVASLILLLAILGILAWPRVVGPWQQHRAWLRLAECHGLTYQPRRALVLPKQGRVVGTYRGRDLTLSTFKDAGVDLWVRVVLSVGNQAKGSMVVIGRPFWDGANQDGGQPSEQPFRIAESQPVGFAHQVFTATGLCHHLREVMQDMQSGHCCVEVSGRMLRFEHKPKSFCMYSVDKSAECMQSLLDVLCELADAVERVPA